MHLKWSAITSYTGVIIYLCGFISEIEGEFQVVEEIVGKLWVHIYHLQQIFSLDGAQIAVTQRSHVCVGLPRLGVQMDHFAEDVIFSCIHAHQMINGLIRCPDLRLRPFSVCTSYTGNGYTAQSKK